MKTGLGEAFGPLNKEEESRLSLFALAQSGSLNDYIQEFTRLSLNISNLDQHSLALWFIQGLSENLRVDAMREHPHTLSEAIYAARVAQRNLALINGNKRQPKFSDRESSHNLICQVLDKDLEHEGRNSGQKKELTSCAKDDALVAGKSDICLRTVQRRRTSQKPLANESTGDVIGEKSSA